MIVEIDFTTDTIIRSSNLEEPDFITKFPAPDDYHPLEYDYIPQTAGVYDPNGFIRKPQETNINLDPFNI
jgi:hypothetical protein